MQAVLELQPVEKMAEAALDAHLFEDVKLHLAAELLFPEAGNAAWIPVTLLAVRMKLDRLGVRASIRQICKVGRPAPDPL